jgi:hypothetical protein
MNALLVASRTGDSGNGEWGPVGRLEHAGGIYRFVYTKGARTLAGFRPFSGMEDLQRVYESDDLFPIFKNRLLPKSRPEYDAYLKWSGFDPDHPPDPISILGVTEGIRQTDSIELFPCPVPDGEGCYINKFFLHGLRWMPEAAKRRVSELEAGDQLLPMPDFCNAADPYAVALRTDGEDRFLIGYVPRYLARDVWKLIGECSPDFIQIFVHRVNPHAPLQQRLLCRMHACWPDGFEPCSDEAFEPIPEGVEARCHLEPIKPAACARC